MVSYVLIAITVLISWMAWQNQSLLEKGIFSPIKVSEQGQYYRFLSSGFLHADFTHLLFNMIALYFFGDFVEQIFQYVFGALGSLYFIALYLSGIIVSEIPSYLKHKNSSHYRSLGASGGVAAVIFVSILYQPTGTIFIYFIPMPSFVFGILYLVFSARMSSGQQRINHQAHLTGSIYGILFALITNPDVVSIFINQLKEFSF
ncbi:MAG: rhomboid family intramembrane serine protease [Bacteroidota bacterium]